MIKRILISFALLITGLAHATWSTDRDASQGYVTVTTLASVIDEAVPFCVVYLSDLPAGFHTAMTNAGDTDGKTIRVSTSDGATQLACYPIGINTGTDTGCLVFLGTGMSASSDVSYRIYTGNAALSMESVSGGMGRNTVFGSYAAAYILNSLTDLTGNGYDMTATGSPTAGVSTGYEGITGYDFNGTSQYLVKTSGVIQNPPITIETWFNADSVAVSFYIAGVCKNSDASNNQMMLNPEGLVGGDPIRSWFRGNGGTIVQAVSSAGFTTGTWRYAACSRDSLTGGTAKAYIDGANKGTNTSDMSSVFSTDRTFIGALTTSTPSGYMDGKIAATLFSSSQRSDDYISTMYDNMNGDMYSVGSWTSTSATTVQADATANKSTRKSSGLLHKAAYLKVTLPSMSGNTVTGATIQYNATTNIEPMNNIDIYARATADTGAWDETSGFATLDALAMGTAISTGNTLTAGTGAKTLNIFGDATKGVSKFYTDNPGGGSITVALVWTGYSGTLNGTTTALHIGDEGGGTKEAFFSARSDATNYPRITITYTAGASTSFPLLLVPAEE